LVHSEKNKRINTLSFPNLTVWPPSLARPIQTTEILLANQKTSRQQVEAVLSRETKDSQILEDLPQDLRLADLADDPLVNLLPQR